MTKLSDVHTNDLLDELSSRIYGDIGDFTNNQLIDEIILRINNERIELRDVVEDLCDNEIYRVMEQRGMDRLDLVTSRELCEELEERRGSPVAAIGEMDLVEVKRNIIFDPGYAIFLINKLLSDKTRYLD